MFLTSKECCKYNRFAMETFFYDRFQSMGYLTAVVSRLLTSRLTKRFAAAGLDLTAEQWAALLQLWNEDGLSQREIAEGLLLEKSSVSRLLDGLERKGLATRTQGLEDVRHKRIFLTEKARSIRDQSVQIARDLLAVAQSGITEAELALCRDVLRRMHRNLAP